MSHIPLLLIGFIIFFIFLIIAIGILFLIRHFHPHPSPQPAPPSPPSPPPPPPGYRLETCAGVCMFNECLVYAYMNPEEKYAIVADIESNSNVVTSMMGTENITLSTPVYNPDQQFIFTNLYPDHPYLFAILSVINTPYPDRVLPFSAFTAQDNYTAVRLALGPYRSTINIIGARQIFYIVKLNKYPDRYLIINQNSGKAIQANQSQSQLTLEIPNQDDPRQRFRFMAIRP